MDFAEILSSQRTHQEMKILKILSSFHVLFQSYDYLNYGPFNLDTKPLPLMAFCSLQTALIQPVLKVNI